MGRRGSGFYPAGRGKNLRKLKADRGNDLQTLRSTEDAPSALELLKERDRQANAILRAGADQKVYEIVIENFPVDGVSRHFYWNGHAYGDAVSRDPTIVRIAKQRKGVYRGRIDYSTLMR